jgi:hypothetical protein
MGEGSMLLACTQQKGIGAMTHDQPVLTSAQEFSLQFENWARPSAGSHRHPD